MTIKRDILLFWRQIRSQAGWLAAAILGAITSTLLTLIIFDQLRQIVDLILAGDSAVFSSSAKILFVLVAAAVVVEYVLHYCSGRFAEGSTATIRNHLIEKIQGLPMEILDGHHSGDIMSRLTNDINLVRDFMAGKTSIVVAHRLSTIKNAQRILVIDQGRVAEAGSHQELLTKKGIYYQLYNTELTPAPGQIQAQEVGA